MKKSSSANAVSRVGWLDAMAIRAMALDEQEAVAGWPPVLTTRRAAVLQQPASSDEYAMKNLWELLDADCDRGTVECGRTDPKRFQRLRIVVDPVTGRGRQYRRLQTSASQYTIAAIDFLQWLTAQGHAPSKHVVAWAKATVPALDFREALSEAAPEAKRIDSDGATVQLHSTQERRRDSLSPVIELARAKCSNLGDTAEVWAALQVLAEQKHAPLLGATSDGLQYLKNGEAAYLTRDALDKRLKRAARETPLTAAKRR